MPKERNAEEGQEGPAQERIYGPSAGGISSDFGNSQEKDGDTIHGIGSAIVGADGAAGRGIVPGELAGQLTEPSRYQNRPYDQPGLVYLIECLSNPGLFKVGQTSRLRKRVKAHAQGRRIRLIWFIATNQATWLERYLMVQWRLFRSHGEWFWLPANWVESFKTVRVVNWKGFDPVELDGTEFDDGTSPRPGRQGYIMRLGEEVAIPKKDTK